jgi:uncharacterized protein (TIGR03435 family)
MQTGSYTLRNGGRFIALAIATKDLIAAAYGLQPWQVVNGAEWLTAARFAIDGSHRTGRRQPNEPEWTL